MKTIRRMLCASLVLVMLFSLCAFPAAAEGDGTLVYFGDSMSFNFPGRHEYTTDLTDIYPKQAAEEFGLTLIDGTHESFGIGGARPTDYYSILSDYPGDGYTLNEIPKDQPTKDMLKGKLSKASVIVTQMGYSSYSVYLLNNILYTVEGKPLPYSTDLSQVFTEEELARALPYAYRCAELVKSMFPVGHAAEIAAYLRENLSDAARSALSAMLGADIVDTVENLRYIGSSAMDSLVYAMVSNTVHFDRTIECILEQKDPDAEIYVMGLTKPLDILNLRFSLGDLHIDFPIGSMFGVILDMFNLHMKVFSEYSDQYYYVDNIRRAECYGEKMQRNYDTALEMVYSILSGKDDHALDGFGEGALFDKAKEITPAAMKVAAITQGIDIVKLVASIPEDIPDPKECFMRLRLNEENEVANSYFEQLLSLVYMVQEAKGLYIHPTQAAHNAEADILINAMYSKKIEPAAIAYHTLTDPVGALQKAMESCWSCDALEAWANSIEQQRSDLKTRVREAAERVLSLFGIGRIVTVDIPKKIVSRLMLTK